LVCPSQHPMPKRAKVLHLQLEPKIKLGRIPIFRSES